MAEEGGHGGVKGKRGESGGCSAIRSSLHQRPAIARCCGGCGGSGWSRSEWKAPVPTAPVWPAIWPPRASSWLRSTGPTGARPGPRASNPARSTHQRDRGPANATTARHHRPDPRPPRHDHDQRHPNRTQGRRRGTHRRSPDHRPRSHPRVQDPEPRDDDAPARPGRGPPHRGGNTGSHNGAVGGAEGTRTPDPHTASTGFTVI